MLTRRYFRYLSGPIEDLESLVNDASIANKVQVTTGSLRGLRINATSVTDQGALDQLRRSEMGLVCLWDRRAQVLTTILSLVRMRTSNYLHIYIIKATLITLLNRGIV